MLSARPFRAGEWLLAFSFKCFFTFAFSFFQLSRASFTVGHVGATVSMVMLTWLTVWLWSNLWIHTVIIIIIIAVVIIMTLCEKKIKVI